jgi:hypothetical protein
MALKQVPLLTSTLTQMALKQVPLLTSTLTQMALKQVPLLISTLTQMERGQTVAGRRKLTLYLKLHTSRLTKWKSSLPEN